MAAHFKRKNQGRRLFGLDRQDGIRFFFGGNAMISVIVLALICIFLFREAILFFPQHHRGLELHRKTGQEYVGHIIQEADEYARLVSLTNQAYYQELDAAYGVERGMDEGFSILEELLEDEGENLIDAWADAQDDLEDSEEGEALTQAKAAETEAAKKWQEFLSEAFAKADRSGLGMGDRLDDENWEVLLAAMREWDPVEGDPPSLVVDAKKRMDEGMRVFEEARGGITKAGASLKRLRGRLTNVASAIKKDVVAGQTAEARKKALLEGAKQVEDPAEQARMRAEAEKIVVQDDFPFEERTKEIVASREEHLAAVAELKEKLSAAVEKLPEEYQSEQSAKLIAEVRKEYPGFEKGLDRSVERAGEWAYDKKLSWWTSSMKFFFGKDWVTNSSWHDFYGLLPLFTGSLLISVIALTVAVPFSIGAAIYVNRLASSPERNVIKPTIEMIQAIPSVVLGFFGIVVLGEGLRELSQVPWLSWIPGFPMQERLTILNAGLLLALMAVPTVFTLCEDALNNVPRSFSEASLALGASKLQTVVKVVLPTASSGVLAAILLGFGRIIGETMVVLLVAGNQIAIPDLGLGFGVVTQPAHTMTGIIAQEMGEVSQGTLHWRGLFLVGLILFVISLTINVTAQKVIRRLGHS